MRRRTDEPVCDHLTAENTIKIKEFLQISSRELLSFHLPVPLSCVPTVCMNRSATIRAAVFTEVTEARTIKSILTDEANSC